jgi:hypothetical protein
MQKPRKQGGGFGRQNSFLLELEGDIPYLKKPKEGHMKKVDFMRLAFIVTIMILFVADGSPCFSQPVPGGPGYVTLSSFSFVPYNPAATYSYGGSALLYTGGGTAYFVAPLNLPHGATINQVTMYYLDNDATNNFSIVLLRYSMTTHLGSTLASVSSSGASSLFLNNSTSTIQNPVVDLASNSYYLQLQFPSSSLLAFEGVRVDYGYGVSLPAIIKN